jgi:hypothetical protein
VSYILGDGHDANLTTGNKNHVKKPNDGCKMKEDWEGHKGNQGS